jgi:cobalt/nickel transport system permease protein
MHIPDGYLSPETCAVLYATAAPFWYVSLQRVKKQLSTQFLPLISVFAAFSFVVMMFNLPLPGGTTGHAIGVGIATVVLGPWASILAISIALVIQSLLFGDGGVTAIGANCFNMAIVGSLVAYGAYRVLGNRAALDARRRVVAAAIAGYAAINVSALCAAIEFGIQPALFHDAAGTPLYCPYPLSISIPAMMIGHLTFAGLAELFITAGVVAYLQRANPTLLMRTAPDAPDLENAMPEMRPAMALRNLRRLWLGLAILLVLTPLGILAVGSAWGEWSAADFAHPPQGLARLSTLWTAPLSGYAPTFIRSGSFGYLVSAATGVGLIILLVQLVKVLLSRRDGEQAAGGKFRRGFVAGTIKGLLEAIEYTLIAEELTKVDGFLQKLDPRVKVVGLASLVVAAATVHRLSALAALLATAILGAAASRVPIMMLVKRIWLPALSFSGLIAIPSIFLTTGLVLYRVPLLAWPVTQQGLTSAGLLILRVETAATLSALLILTTEWASVLRALRFFRVPVTAVVILGMTYRYLFLLLRTAHEMLESRKSRLVGSLEGPERRRLAAASVGVLLSKSFQLSTEVHSAMLARGFQGEVYILDEPAIHGNDWLHLGAFIAIAAIMLLVGR